MAYPRVRMRLSLTPQTIDPAVHARTITDADSEALASLMWDAYRGTIDDGGETLDDARREVRIVFGGGYGPLLTDCSFVSEANEQAIAATLVVWYEQEQDPLLAFVMTHPAYTNRGLAAALIKHTINALIARGYGALSLVVTDGNAPAQHLYTKLGFRVWKPDTKR